MRKNELVRETAKRTGYTIGVCDEIISECFQVIIDTLAAHEEVRLPNIGIFEVKTRKGRNYYNVSKNEMSRYEDSKILKFRASSLINDLIRK